MRVLTGSLCARSSRQKNQRRPYPADTVYAHGLIGLELQTIDRYDDTQNRNGTQDVTVFVNDKQVYNHHIDRVPFDLSNRYRST